MMRRRPIAAVLLMSTVACTTIQPVARPGEYIPAKQPKFVVLTTADRPTPLVMNGPRMIAADTLVGFVAGEYTEVPLSRVRTMQAEEFSKKKTYLTAGAFVVATGLFVALLAGGSGSAEEDTSEDAIGRITLFRFGR